MTVTAVTVSDCYHTTTHGEGIVGREQAADVVAWAPAANMHWLLTVIV